MKPRSSLLFVSLALAPMPAIFAAPAPQKLPRATQNELEKLLAAPQIQSGHVGISVRALGEAASPASFAAKPFDGAQTPTLFARNEQKRFVPASNMKLFTAGYVLQALGAKTRLKTRVFAAKAQFLGENVWPKSVPEPFVVTLVGGGDPSLSTSDLDALASRVAPLLKAPLIVRAQNSLEGDALNAENNGARYPDGWTLDDALWYYGAPVTGLSVNRNHVDLTVKAAPKAGEAPEISASPEAPLDFLNLVNTVENGETRLGFERGDRFSPLGERLTISGQIAVGKSQTEGVAVPDPREWARQIFADALKKHGAQVVEPQAPFAATEQSEIGSHESPEIGVLMQRFLKNSDNLYGELLLRVAAPKTPVSSEKSGAALVVSTGRAQNAHRAMSGWLFDSQSLRFSDGSGLSRYNLLTPRAVSGLLAQMQTATDGAAFYEALPVAGVDGTLKNRMKTGAATNNARAKTGTFSIVNCLSGYVTTRDGKRLAVAILTNGVESGEAARQWQGQVFEALANARWK